MSRFRAYVIFTPRSIAGIYDSWPECERMVSGATHADFQGFKTRAAAERAFAIPHARELADEIRSRARRRR